MDEGLTKPLLAAKLHDLLIHEIDLGEFDEWFSGYSFDDAEDEDTRLFAAAIELSVAEWGSGRRNELDLRRFLGAVFEECK